MRIDRMWLHFPDDCIIVNHVQDLEHFNLAVATIIELKVIMTIGEFEAFKEWKAAQEPQKIEKVAAPEPVKVERDYSY